MLFNEALINFMEKYKGPKLAIIATGAGISLAQIALIPGASKVLQGIRIPYDEKDSDKIIRLASSLEGYKHVCMEVASAFVEYLMWQEYGDAIDGKLQYIGITGSLTTNRWRKGQNEVFVRFSGPVETCVHMAIPKLDEPHYNTLGPQEVRQIRLAEDEMVSKTIFAILLGEKGGPYGYETIKNPSKTG